jgi:hypothetical protein
LFAIYIFIYIYESFRSLNVVVEREAKDDITI